MPRRLSIAIHVLLAALVLLPLSYYLGDDPRDERWAWRMFSPVRLEGCGAVFLLGEDQTPLSKTSEVFHAAWINIANRGRKEVIEAMAAHLCEGDGAGGARPGLDVGSPPQVRVRLLCERRPGSASNKRRLYDLTRRESDDDIELVSKGLFNMCTSGRL